MATTLKDAADDAAFINSLMALTDFSNKVYIKAVPTDEVYTKATTDTTFVKTAELKTKAADKDVVKAILTAKDGNNLVLAEEVAKEPVVKKILSVKNAAGTKTVLAEEIAKEPVVKDILGVKNAAGTKTVLAEEIAKEPVVKDILGVKNAAGTKTVLAEKVADKDIAGAILGAQDDKKSILVEELGKALDRVANDTNDKVYGTGTDLKIAKDFLGGKGMQGLKGDSPSASDVAAQLVANNKDALVNEIKSNSNFQNTLAGDTNLQNGVKTKLVGDSDFKAAVTTKIDAEDAGFQGAVRTVMSKLNFDIPTSTDEPLSWDLI